MDGKPFSTGERIGLGHHLLEANLQGVEPLQREFSVFYGGKNLGVLNLERSKGEIYLSSYPEDAEFDISGDGQHWQGELPIRIQEVWDMSKRLRNWNYRDVIGFLKENGFCFDKELGGSHQAWIKRGENGAPDRRVEVNFTHSSYPVLTLKTMIRQSGIEAKEWIKWAGS